MLIYQLEVPTIYNAYIRPKFQGIYPQNMAKHMVQFRTSICWILEFPLNIAQIIIMSGIWLVYSHIYHHN